MIMLVPSMYLAILKEEYLREIDFSFLKYCISLGEPCHPSLATNIHVSMHGKVVSAYGLSECIPGIAYSREDLEANHIKPGSTGKHLFGDIKLVNELGEEDPAVGELVVRNATVHDCYLDEQLNRKKIVDGWFHTGDVFHRDEDGFFFSQARKDNMFMHNGKNIYPVEVEKMLLAHPSIHAACMVPVKDREEKTYPAVLIQTKADLTAKQVIAYALKHCATHTVPKVVAFTDALPAMGLGKVDRRQVTKMLQGEFDREAQCLQPGAF
jgi:acyl-coenzyme A synthetase/AMP-(fatty) acid ligase